MKCRRGAILLTVIGSIAVAGSIVFFGFASIRERKEIVPIVAAASATLLIAGLGRLVLGRALEGGPELLERHRQEPPHLGSNLMRLAGLVVDAALPFLGFTVGGEIIQDILKADRDVMALVGGGIGLGAVLIPAAVWGASAGMLIFGFRWVRGRDGERIGAFHALLRVALGVAVLPLAAVLSALAFLFIPNKWKAYTNKGIYRFRDSRGKFVLAFFRRSLADVFLGTEALRPSWIRKLPPPPPDPELVAAARAEILARMKAPPPA